METQKLEIKNQSMGISPKGMSIASWEVHGVPILFSHSAEGKERERISHVCFPAFGEIKPVQGMYNFPRHGFIRDTILKNKVWYRDLSDEEKKFSKEKKGRVASCHAEFPHHANSMFNFNFKLEMEVTLFGESSFHQHLRVSHKGKIEGDRKMPVAPAFHPYFVSPYGDTFVEVEGEGRIHSFLKSDEKVQKKIMFQNLSQKWRKESKRIIVRIPGLGSILMILDGFAEMKKGGINIWREKSSYICVEPVSCFSGDFERGDSPFLAEGTSADLGCTYRFSPNPDDVFEN